MITLLKTIVVVTTLLLINSSTLYAQAQIQIPEKEKLSYNVRTINPALQSQAGPISALSSINLTSLFNDTRAEVKVAMLAGGTVFNVGVAQSFSKKPEIAKLFDATGLSTGTTFSAGFQTRIGRIKVPSQVTVLDIARFEEIKEQFREEKKKAKDVTISWVDLDPATRTKVINSGVLNPKAFETPLLFTFQFSASRVGFDYIADTLATKPLSGNQTNRAISFSLSKFTSLDFFWAISYSALYTYRSGDDVLSYSFPVGNKGLTYAKDVTVGTPTEKFESKLKGEFRQLFRKEGTPFIGINPGVSVLFTSGKGNIDLPVYFITQDDKGLFNNLQAGFRVGYTSKLDDSFLRDFGSFSSDKMYFSLFLSKPFSVQ
jgi:hypothetical protein